MRNHPFGPWVTALPHQAEAKLNTFWSRRMARLPHLGQGGPTLSRRCRQGLLGLAMIVVAMPALPDTSAARQDSVDRAESQDAAKAAAADEDDEGALEQVFQTYRLAPGQNLKRVPPPRPEGFRAWWRRSFPGRESSLDQNRAMIFRWSDPDHRKQLASLYGGEKTEGWPLRDLPQLLRMEIDPSKIEGDPELLKAEVGGDWIVRKGVPAEQLIRPLESIVQRALRQRITFRFRQVERDVVVARGRYHYSPLPGRSDNQIEIYANYLDTQETVAAGLVNSPPSSGGSANGSNDPS
jgi:hypothetical protein